MNSQELDEVTASVDDPAHKQPTSGSCPFMTKLPREIRDMIYVYLIGSNSLYSASVFTYPLTSMNERDRFTIMLSKAAIIICCGYPRSPLNTNILDVSKQMREECLSVFFRLCRLQGFGPDELLSLFAKIGPEHLRLISYISIDDFLIGGDSYPRYPDPYRRVPFHAIARVVEDICKIAKAFRMLADCQRLKYIRLSVPASVGWDLDDWLRFSRGSIQVLIKKFLLVQFVNVGLGLSFDESYQEPVPFRQSQLTWHRRRQ